MHLITTVLLTLSWIITGPVGPRHEPVRHTSTSAVATTGISDLLVAEAAAASPAIEAAAVITTETAVRCSTPRLLRKKRNCR